MTISSPNPSKISLAAPEGSPAAKTAGDEAAWKETSADLGPDSNKKGNGAASQGLAAQLRKARPSAIMSRMRREHPKGMEKLAGARGVAKGVALGLIPPLGFAYHEVSIAKDYLVNGDKLGAVVETVRNAALHSTVVGGVLINVIGQKDSACLKERQKQQYWPS